jgi:hypothetical protein
MKTKVSLAGNVCAIEEWGPYRNFTTAYFFRNLLVDNPTDKYHNAQIVMVIQNVSIKP